MPRTGAERQHDYRQRHSQRIAALEAEAVDLRRQLDTAEVGLQAAHAEIERLSAMACKHPAAAVDGGVCRACGAEVW